MVIAVAGTIFTVLGSLLVLAGVMGWWNADSFSALDLLRLIGSLLAYSVVVAYIFPKITRWFSATTLTASCNLCIFLP